MKHDKRRIRAMKAIIKQYASTKTDAWIANGTKVPIASVKKMRQRLGIKKTGRKIVNVEE